MSRTVRLAALVAAVVLLVTTALLLASGRRDQTDAGTAPLTAGSEVRGQIGAERDPPMLSAGVAGAAPPLGRPARAPTHPDENPHPPPPAVVGEAFVNAIVLDAPVLLADVALPWRYQISEEALARVDEAVIHEAIADWGGHPGSRWSSAFDGTTPVNKAVADGRSVVFAETSCTGITNANAYLFTDGGLGIARYGASGTQILEADIGLCPRIADEGQLRRAIRHETGHVVGLAHQCSPADECYRPEMGEVDSSCRVMYWQARVCQDALAEGDLVGLRALYPTVRPLVGPTMFDTAARASFATIADGEASLAVVLDPASGAALAGAAAALAGRTGGPLLLAEPDEERCVEGAAREELNRTLGRRGEAVFVGTWPSSCRRLGIDWDLAVRLVATDDVVAGAQRLAALRPWSGAPVIVAQDAAMVAGAGVAADLNAPVLSAIGGVDDRLVAWLSASSAHDVIVVGGEPDGPVVEAMVGNGLDVRHFSGNDPVALSVVLATTAVEPPAGDVPGLGGSVVLGPASTSPEAFVAAAVAGALHAPLLLSPGSVDPRVTDALSRLAPSSGWAVDAHRTLPWDVVADYGLLVGTS